MKTYRVFMEHPTRDEKGEPVIKLEMNINAEHSGIATEIMDKMHPELVTVDAVEVL